MMARKNSSSPDFSARAPVRESVCTTTRAGNRSLPKLPNGMRAVRDPGTGQVRVVRLSSRPLDWR